MGFFTDQHSRGRGNRTLTDADVETIREIRRSRGLSHREIADIVGCAKTTVGDVLRNTTWGTSLASRVVSDEPIRCIPVRRGGN